MNVRQVASSDRAQEVGQNVKRRLSISKRIQVGLSSLALATGLLLGASQEAQNAVAAEITQHLPQPDTPPQVPEGPLKAAGVAVLATLAFGGTLDRLFSRYRSEQCIQQFSRELQIHRHVDDLKVEAHTIQQKVVYPEATLPGATSFERLPFAALFPAAGQMAALVGGLMLAKGLTGNYVPNPEIAELVGPFYTGVGGTLTAVGGTLLAKDVIDTSAQNQAYQAQIALLDAGLIASPQL